MRVLRVIARMNVGGPAQHVSILSGRLDPERYETLLVAGRVGLGEVSAEHLAHERGAQLYVVGDLAPEVHALADIRAFLQLLWIIRRFQPDIVHTHTAKAGFLGRAAALLAVRPRPRVVHTYHGHVLEGYFGRVKTRLYRALEKGAAKRSDVLVGVSHATVDDLVRLGIAKRQRFRVIPLGLELDPFLELDEQPHDQLGLRLRAGVGAGELLVTVTGRLVPIKRVDVALAAVALARRRGAGIRLAVVGDGEDREALKARASQLGLEGSVYFAGFLDDMAAVVAATDIALLTSDNEGTPVALIEAAAGARPAVATDVGGVRHVVTSAGGLLGPAGDVEPLAAALVELAGDVDRRHRLGRAAREHVKARFGATRLLAEIDDLYSSFPRRRDGR